MLKPGMTAPDFILSDADMEGFELSMMRGKQQVVLFFYPRDGMPLATREAIEFSDYENDFERLNCEVIGISRDDPLAHAEFRDQHGLSVRLLSDEDGKVSRLYGVFRMKEKDGIKRQCVVPSTFVIDRQGVLRHVLYDIQTRGHVAEVLQLLKQLEKPCKSAKIPS